jgi:uncharacterized membrane protein YeiB
LNFPVADDDVQIQPGIASADHPALAPISGDERIQALDVIRGVALLGIFLMNVEWFNRPIADLELGLPLHAAGIDYAAGWGIHTFVRGKFWTMFSLLFGMGFAVMLGRAERAGRDFARPYLRRIAALALIGAAHYVLVWTGDILFSYALGAGGLMLLFYAPPLLLLLLISVSTALGLALGEQMFLGLAASLVVVGLAGLFIRSDDTIAVGDADLPLVSLLLGQAGLVTIAVGAFYHLPGAFFGGAIALIGAWLSIRYRNPPASRPWRTGAFIYLTPFLAMALSGLTLTVAPQLKPAMSAEQLVEAQKRRDEQARDSREEVAAMTGDSYARAVRHRARIFAKEAGGDTGFAVIVLGMFLIGVWFVQSGTMADTAANLPMFRKMAWWGLPVGLGMSLTSSAIAVSSIPGRNGASYELATGLLMLGNLPACLGYVGVIVLMLHSRRPFAKISLLAPAGRMALTNYLCQSIVQSIFFYGYFLGHWGMGRARQVLFVLVVFALQVAFSRWWLSMFRYGPMEWLWRAATYWRWPAMRRVAAA